MWAAVRLAGAAASDPSVPQQALNEIELAFAKGLTFADARSPDDHLGDTAVGRRQANGLESRLELFPREVNGCAHHPP